MSDEVLFFKTKADFMAYCEQIWEQGKTNDYQLFKGWAEPRAYTYMGERKTIKIKTDIFLTEDLFTKQKTVHPVLKSLCFPFVAIKRENITDNFRSE